MKGVEPREAELSRLSMLSMGILGSSGTVKGKYRNDDDRYGMGMG